jgi:alginate O-acetyltransferase complex protein AlgI
MVFSSLFFLFVFLPVVLILYYISPKFLRNIVILASGLVFYAWGEPIYVIVMMISIFIDYFAGRMIHRFDSIIVVKRLALITSLVMNLSLLGVFKYSGFIVENLNNLFGTSFFDPNLPLPIGISFFTFQSMSYTIDLYMKKIGVQKNFITFAAFVTLFPQIVAGPIVRYQDIEEELKNRKINIDTLYEGILQFINGLAKKVLIANNIGLLWDTVKTMEMGSLSAVTAWIGILAFTFQIYFDFSGYSDMALGMGKMMGFHFPENFHYPYQSKSVSEFWRRWHITLGSWFKSYVYFPLGGSKEGKGKTIRNLVIVWFLTGLWHGASWNFVVWGLYFGALIILERLFLGKLLEKVPKFFRIAYTFLMAVFGWVFFDTATLSEAFRYFGAMFGGSGTLIDSTTLYLLKNYGVFSSFKCFCIYKFV